MVFAAPATGTDEPFMPVGNGSLGAASLGNFGGIGTLPPSAARSDAAAGLAMASRAAFSTFCSENVESNDLVAG
jgi:hypothetical protein